MIRTLKQYWFPAALIALVVLFIPGLVLFALNLFGWEKSTNNLLVDRLNLSYHLPIPWWGILLLLLVPPLIVLLYFLKLKRKPLSVPSTFLWKKSIEDLHVNSLFQWLRENVLLLLQVLAVIFIIYGVMAFHLHGQTGSGRHYILMIDNSASMSATDVEPTRLDWAKKEALKVIDSATDDDFGMVIVFNSSAKTLQSYTSNRALLRQAVKDITQTERATKIEEALNLADTLANPRRSTENAAVAPEAEDPSKARTYVSAEGTQTEVHLFSDGRFPDLSDNALTELNVRALGDSPLGNLQMNYHAAGKMFADVDKDNREIFKPTEESRDNVGIVTFNARRDEEEEAKRRELLEAGKLPEEIEPGKLYLILGLRNYSDADAYVAIEVFKEEKGRKEPVLDQDDMDGGPRKTRVVPKRKVSQEKEAGKEELVERAEPGEATVALKTDDISNRASAIYYARLIQFADEEALKAYQRDGSRTRVRNDKFAMDDEAWLVVGVARKSRVLIVSDGNDALSSFFKQPATEYVADVVWIAPNELGAESYRKPARNGDFDLVIFDACAPAEEKDMPRSNTFFIGRPPPPWRIPPADGKTDPNFKFYVENLPRVPRIKGWDSKSPVLKWLNALYEVVIMDAFTIRDLPQRDRLIETDKNATLLFTQDRGPFTDLVLTFTLVEDNNRWNSDWPLKPNFPQFLRNVLYSLGNITDQASEDRVQPGDPKKLRPDMTARRGFVTDPDGKETLLAHEERDLRTDFSFDKTDRLGVYQVRWEDTTERPFAVNLLDREESNIEPRPAFHVGSVTIGNTREIGQPREVWKYFALLALLVLLLEWYIYNRRVYI
jgi:hypothetical protein